MTAKPATVRSQARYRRAAVVLPKITLNEAEAEALAAIQAASGETKTGVIRRLIAEAKPPQSHLPAT